jgi:hypothetical protein
MFNPTGSSCFKNEHKIGDHSTIRGLIHALQVVW